jgi:putative addiction module killer protein
MPQYFFLQSQEYQKWAKKQPACHRVQIALRLSRIEIDGYFGIHKYLDDGVWELKWGNGRRLYYAYIPEKKILLLLGGDKNGQSKDIARAKKIVKNYVEREA